MMLVPRDTVEAIVQRRNRALEKYAAAHDAIANASAALVDASKEASFMRREASRFTVHQRDEERAFLGHIQLPERDGYMATARRLTDTECWSHIVSLTGLERLMDKKAKDQMTQQLMKEPPEVTVDNVFATLEQFAADSGTIWRRGIAECFTNLDRRFRSHDGWKIGSRIILTRAFNDWGSWNYHRNERDTLMDIERVFFILDGKRVPDNYAGIVGAVEASRSGGMNPRQSECESDYFKVRGFMNGNAHVWFKRDDLVKKVNKLLGEYYGAPIPEDREPDEDTGFHNPKTAIAKNYAFFPTPDAAADELVEQSSLYRMDNEAPLLILEPSAGTGNLVRRLRKCGAIVDAVEVHPNRARGLLNTRLCRDVTCCDFLLLKPGSALYDRVVMNPPFDRERDIDHVMHALEFLKPDGLLTAIMSAGTEFRETKKAESFRKLMEKMNASWRDLPAGSFASVGTYCNTVILKVWKDGKQRYR